MRLIDGREIEDSVYFRAISEVPALVRAAVASYLLEGRQHHLATLRGGLTAFEAAVRRFGS